jgi:hypothetical protein
MRWAYCNRLVRISRKDRAGVKISIHIDQALKWESEPELVKPLWASGSSRKFGNEKGGHE